VWVFAAVIAVAVPVLLYQGRDQWFLLDEWDFLANRTAGSPSDLFDPHYQHWTTVPILVYRALWWLVGLRHYWPYQLTLIVLHLGAAILLRAVMRRAGVRPWIATTAASLFAVFGAGREDILMAFQICYTGALTLGLAHLLLADHDGPLDRRDAFGVLCGLLALMCSAVGITMALAVGIATLIRRGWRVALAHTAPLGLAFVVWWATVGRESPASGEPSLRELAQFVRDVFINVFHGLGQWAGVGFLLAFVTTVGAVLAFARQSRQDFRRYDGPTVGLASAAFIYATTTGYGRATVFAGPPPASAQRYVHIVAALSLPLIALAASAIVDRWRVAYPAVIAMFLVAVPGNVSALHASGTDRFLLGDRGLVLTMSRLPLAHEVPRSSRPLSRPKSDFTIGWLLDGVANGKIPEPGPASERTRAQAELLLSVGQGTEAPLGACAEVDEAGPLHVQQGDQIHIRSFTLTIRRVVDGNVVASRSYFNGGGRTLTILAGPLDLLFERASRSQAPLHCR
jgi:hypothetical protein